MGREGNGDRPNGAPQPVPQPVHGRPTTDPAKARFYFIAAHRVVGAALVVLGMLAIEGALGWGRGLGKVLAATGLVVFFVVPLLLARAWRTPRDPENPG